MRYSIVQEGPYAHCNYHAVGYERNPPIHIDPVRLQDRDRHRREKPSHPNEHCRVCFLLRRIVTLIVAVVRLGSTEPRAHFTERGTPRKRHLPSAYHSLASKQQSRLNSRRSAS